MMAERVSSSDSHKPYPEYKYSGVEWLGDLPTHWDCIKLKYVATFKVLKIVADSTRKYVGMENIESWSGKYIPKQDETPEGLSTSFTREDVLFGKLRPYLAKSWLAEFDGICSSEFLVLKSEQVSPKFLNYYLLTEEFIKQVDSSTYGSKMPRASWDFIGLMNVSVPSQLDSERIANFLDHETAKIDTLIAKQQQLITLLKEKRQAVISHAVTKGLNPNAPMRDSGVEWLGEVPEHWDVVRIKNLSIVISKGTTPSTIGGDFVDDGVRFLKGENIGKSLSVQKSPEFFITEDVDDQISRSRLEEDDVLVIIAGATTGMSSILQKDLLPANTNQAVSFIRPKYSQHSKLIVRWLSTEFAQRIIWMGAVQAAQPNLSMEDLGNIPIAVPPQKELSNIIKDIDQQLAHLDELHSKAIKANILMQERRTALISAAVTGKIDVRNWQAPQYINDNKEVIA